MRPPQKRDLYFEEIGQCFNEWMSEYDVERRIHLIKTFLSSIDTSGLHCLEVGWNWQSKRAISPFFEDYVAADISEKLAMSVGERLGLHWMKIDACNMDILNGTYDLVISSECIEHTADPEKALTEMARVLKPGGTIIVTSPNKLWYPVLWVSIATKIRKFHGHEKWLFPRKAAIILKACGIKDIHFSGCHLFPWQIPYVRHILPAFDKFGRLLYLGMINYGICGVKAKN